MSYSLTCSRPDRRPALARARRVAAALLVFCVFAPAALAQQGGGKRRPPAATQPKEFPSKAVIDVDLAAVDDGLAAHMQARGDPAADGAARLEMLIDLRLTARWLLAAAAGERPGTDLQVAAVLRAEELLATAGTAAEGFKASPRPTPGQLDGMAKLHAVTFRLPELKQVKQADDVCREVGALLVVAAGPLPVEARQIPPMRPAPVARRPNGTKRPPPPPPAGDPLARASGLAVSAPLKRQVLNLLTLGMSARAAARTDGKRAAEANALEAAADQGLELAEGLAANAALDPKARPKMEQQLADGLALFADPRTRGVGRQRLAALDDYGKRLARIRRLDLPADLQQRLAPAFAWAGENPDRAGELIKALERYLAECGRMDARAAATRPVLPQREAKAVADALKIAIREREEFLVDAGLLGRPGQRADVKAMGLRVDALRSALDAIDTYERVPAALQALSPFKPRPTGGLDRRVAGLVAAVLDPRPSPLKDESETALPDLVRLSELAAEVNAPAAVPADVQQLYARGKLAAFDARRRDLVTALAEDLAAAKALDPARIDRLTQMRAVRAALTDAVALELAVRRTDVLARWVDWPVQPTEVSAVVTPYRDAIASLVEAYATDAAPAVAWEAVDGRYGPLIRLLVRLSAYADASAALPAGMAGHVGRLMTPIDVQPFAAERRAAVAVKLWARYQQAGDAASAAAAAEALDRDDEGR